MTICVNFLLIAFALLRIFALIWHFSCFGKVAKFRVGHGHGLAQVFHLSWVLEQSQEKLKTMLIQNLGGANKLHYGRCASGEWQGDNFYHLCLNSGSVFSFQLQFKFPSFK